MVGQNHCSVNFGIKYSIALAIEQNAAYVFSAHFLDNIRRKDSTCKCTAEDFFELVIETSDSDLRFW